MMTLREAQARGHANHGWLDTYFTFSFADYYDPDYMGFRALRVINEDHIQPGKGFDPHPHQDMEILTYVLEGALTHQDNLGNGSVIRAGEFQRMTAGRGVRHSEYNGSEKDAVHLLQIWLFPHEKNLTPSYEQKSFQPQDRENRFCLVGSQEGRDGSLTIHQDVLVYLAALRKGNDVVHAISEKRYGWVQVVRGEIVVNGQSVSSGSGLALRDESRLQIGAKKDSELLFFDLA